jgi:glycosyltransferase involved in cell wall biosynthesis
MPSNDMQARTPLANEGIAAREPAAGVATLVSSDMSKDAREGAKPRRPDVLFVMNSLNIGGTERKIVRLANQFAARGISVSIVYLNEPETLAPMLNPAVSRQCLHRRGRFSLGAARRLAAIIGALEPRVVVGANLYPSLYVLAARRLARHKPAIAALVNITDMGPTQRLQQRFYRALLTRFDTVVYGCRVQLEAWVTGDCARQRATVLYNGVDLDEFTKRFSRAEVIALREKFGFGARSFVIGSVGRLYMPKNQSALIDSVAMLRRVGLDARLLLAGDGPDREALRQYAERLGVTESVVMTGNVSDVRPVLEAMDVFVLPSLYVETFSNAALEAMAMCTPVILSDIAGATEMVRDGVDGYVIAPDRINSVLPSLLAQLAADERLRTAIGARARKRVEESFSFQAMVDRYADLIRQLGERGPA